LLTLLSVLCGSAAHAHVTLEQTEGPVGSSYKAVFRVPHGCGASPTVKIRVRIPDGMVGVKPMPKPGWTLDIVKGPYDRPYALFHGNVSEGVKEVGWSGGRLPDDYYDEFVLTGFISDALAPGRTLYFPVVQECENGVHRWIEIPQDGKPSSELKEPAPALKLLPKK
jgi:uncharacterized protein YcnI